MTTRILCLLTNKVDYFKNPNIKDETTLAYSDSLSRLFINFYLLIQKLIPKILVLLNFFFYISYLS